VPQAAASTVTITVAVTTVAVIRGIMPTSSRVNGPTGRAGRPTVEMTSGPCGDPDRTPLSIQDGKGVPS
jgi:hypothetical protein